MIIGSRGIGGIVGLMVVALLAATSYAEDMKASVKVSGGGTYDYVVVGGINGAEDGFDYVYDTVSPGPNMNETYIVTSIPHPEWGAVKDDFRADIRSSETNQEWAMTVESNLPAGTPLSLNLDGTNSAVPETYSLSVTDAETGAEVILDGTSPYEFSSPGGGASKQLIVRAYYTPPVIEEPVVEDDTAGTGDTSANDDPAETEEDAATDENVDEDDTAAQATDEDMQEDDNPADLNDGSSSDTFYLAGSSGEPMSAMNEHSRAVPSPPAIRSLSARASENGPRMISAHGRAAEEAALAGDTGHNSSDEPVTCGDFVDSDGASIIYCGKGVSREAMLRRVNGEEMPRKGVEFVSGSSDNAGGSSFERIILALGHGLQVAGLLPVERVEASTSHGWLGRGMSDRLTESLSYRIAGIGIDRLVELASENGGHYGFSVGAFSGVVGDAENSLNK